MKTRRKLLLTLSVAATFAIAIFFFYAFEEVQPMKALERRTRVKPKMSSPFNDFTLGPLSAAPAKYHGSLFQEVEAVRHYILEYPTIPPQFEYH